MALANGMPRWKYVANRGLTTIENRIMGTHLSEAHTGYRAYSRRLLLTVPFLRNAMDFSFDSELIMQAAQFGMRIEEVPASCRYFERRLVGRLHERRRLRAEDPVGVPAAGAPSGAHPALTQVQGSRRRHELSPLAESAAPPAPGRAVRPTASAALLALVGGITLVGLLVRLPSFGQSIYGDELSTFFIVTGSTLGHVLHQLEDARSVDLNPPLFFAAAWLAERFGESAELLRLPSLLAGVATIPLTCLLGLWTVGRRAGLVGAALVALSPFMIFYSTEARSFALLILLGLLSTLALLRAIETGGGWWWAAYAVCSCAAAYTNYTAVFLLAAQAAWALWAAPRARVWVLGANLAAALAYLPAADRDRRLALPRRPGARGPRPVRLRPLPPRSRALGARASPGRASGASPATPRSRSRSPGASSPSSGSACAGGARAAPGTGSRPRAGRCW